MKKNYKYGIILGVLIVIFVAIVYYNQPDMSSQIKDYLINSGYSVESNDNTLLYRRISSNTINRFSLADYTFNQIIEENNQIVSYLNQTYDFKKHLLTYNYRIEYSDNINVIFRGNYENDSFTCSKEFSTASMSKNEVDNTCSLIRIKVERFYNEADVLFNNYSFIKYMENLSE